MAGEIGIQFDALFTHTSASYSNVNTFEFFITDRICCLLSFDRSSMIKLFY